ncbi:MAG: DUF29 domain-containing protein [Cyanobacterium sp.]
MDKLYDQDFAYWAEVMAQNLEQKNFSGLDIENLVEEIRDLSKRERDKLLSSIRLIIHHLLKWDYQPQKCSRSWQISITRERNNLDFYLEDSPSLKKYLATEWVTKVYRNASLDAMKETGLDFPTVCPYSIDDILTRELS